MKTQKIQRRTHFDDEMRKDRIFIIYGPPGGGKSSYVRSRKEPADIVLDLDRICAAISMSSIHGDHRAVYDTAWRIYDFMVDQIDAGSLNYDRCWIITTNQAKQIQAKTGGEIIEVDPGINETLRRIEADETTSEDEKRRRKDAALGYYYTHGGKT